MYVHVIYAWMICLCVHAAVFYWLAGWLADIISSSTRATLQSNTPVTRAKRKRKQTTTGLRCYRDALCVVRERARQAIRWLITCPPCVHVSYERARTRERGRESEMKRANTMGHKTIHPPNGKGWNNDDDDDDNACTFASICVLISCTAPNIY